MPVFSLRSKQRLALAHPLLQRVMNAAILKYDFTILDSQRGRAAQELAFRQGNSKAHFLDSAHNWSPSVALDIAPFPVDWGDKGTPLQRAAALARFEDLADIVMDIAKQMNIPLRWGGDWDMDGKRNRSGLVDLPHFELNPWREFAKHCKPYEG